MSDIQKTAHHTNFIKKIIDSDIAEGKHEGRVVTRFPPEPNGYLHIGHPKSICLNFGIAEEYNRGFCYLRFDDTNPSNESEEYMAAIKRDVAWLGYDWGDHLRYASDYFDEIYQAAVTLIKKGLAYVCSLSAEETKAHRGTLTEAGKPSPDRDRSIDDNLDLFERMKNGEFKEGEYTLRAKIDMTSGNINLRDPMLYRIRHIQHHRTGDKWCIYPMYDFTHPISDALEGITHSLCTLEFQDHRPLYDWVIEHTDMPHHPQQIEFSRLNINYAVTSKRKLKKLVEDGVVDGWNDPRMPTISGIRRRGFTPASIRHFCDLVGISKQDSIIDMSVLEESVRNDLNPTAERRMAVLRPIKVVITNYPDDKVEMLNVPNHPQNPDLGRRDLPFSKTIYVDADDFMLDPPKKYFRLAPGKEARLLYAYVIRCDEVIQDDQGNVTELRCTYDPDTLGGKKPADGRKVKGNIHWLSAEQAIDAEVRLYDRLFNVENPGAADDVLTTINEQSLETVQAKVEPSLVDVQPETRLQFNRLGYFCADQFDSKPGRLIFNRTVALRDTWAK